ncbi:glutaredoxin family protein [Alteribacter keqinensis]|uniref:Glutaredoxin family protein n=1 Tax=Alteribacter keqinensis TaxID=2483800 RepID=A0A3M7TPE7_9BACI|nr:glutaredoxin family protein [Alteribacter keqinensis]RNA67504.1 glutaredoxin family protein [Alteribacter keqinensis]
MKLTFYTKKDCPLCEGGLAVLEMLREDYPFTVKEMDIYEDDALLEKYQIRIPVIEDDKGKVLEEGNISYFTLKQKLNDLFTT